MLSIYVKARARIGLQHCFLVQKLFKLISTLVGIVVLEVNGHSLIKALEWNKMERKVRCILSTNFTLSQRIGIKFNNIIITSHFLLGGGL